jgi:hypothetical protein
MTQKIISVSSIRKKAIAWGTVFSLKNDLKRKEFRDIDPRKIDRAIRV